MTGPIGKVNAILVDFRQFTISPPHLSLLKEGLSLLPNRAVSFYSIWFWPRSHRGWQPVKTLILQFVVLQLEFCNSLCCNFSNSVYHILERDTFMAHRSLTKAAVVFALTLTPITASAGNDLVGGIIGGVIGAAVMNGGNKSRQRSTSKPRVSSAVRAERREIQTALNYFGFPAGTPDGVLGRKSRAAVSGFQVYLGYPATGQLSEFEKNFLLNSHRQALAGGYATQQLIATKPQGAKGLLIDYRGQMVAGQQANPPVAAPPATQVATTPQSLQSAVPKDDLDTMRETYEALADQVSVLRAMLEFMADQEDSHIKIQKVELVQAKVNQLEQQQAAISADVERRYQTPIRPENANLGITALKASELYQKVPYYVPGTRETGEMWVAPQVTDAGELLYSFSLRDPNAEFAGEREKIMMQPAEITLAARAFDKVLDWSEAAQKKNLRRRFEKRVDCFPVEYCGEKRTGTTSTEVVFMLYEDGSTAAKVQRNKGTFSAGYNLSVESALVLSAYLDFMHEVGEKEFSLGTMTDDEMDALFE